MHIRCAAFSFIYDAAAHIVEFIGIGVARKTIYEFKSIWTSEQNAVE